MEPSRRRRGSYRHPAEDQPLTRTWVYDYSFSKISRVRSSGRAPPSGMIGVLARNRAMPSSDCSFAGNDGDAPIMKEKSFSVPNRLRLLVRPKLTADIRKPSSAMCPAETPTSASIWHTASGNTEGNLSAWRIGMRIGRRDRSLMKIRAWRRPIRCVLPYQSPSRVVDSIGGRLPAFFNRARSCRVQRRGLGPE